MKFLLLFCFLCSLAAGGVDFLRLKPDFSRSDWRPQVTGGVLREESLAVLAAYFSGHGKG